MNNQQAILRETSSFLSFFQSLPIEIEREILDSYLFRFEKFLFVHTTKKFFTLRKQLRTIQLNTIEAWKFYSNAAFREKIYSLIDNPLNQLSIMLDAMILQRTVLDLFTCPLPVHHMTIIGFQELLHLEILQSVSSPVVVSLDISQCEGLINIEYFKGIRFLKLSNCKNIQIIDKIQEVQGLKFIRCNSVIRDVQPFRSLHKLILGDCNEVEDVSPLANIYDLTIERCAKLTNINTLTHNYYLQVNSCYGITEINYLSSRNLFVCRDCRNLENFTLKGDIACLHFDNCDNLSIISVAGKIKHLQLSSCEGLINVDEINADKIFLSCCDHVVSISPLLLVKHLDIEGCDAIQVIEGLRVLESLHISGCPQLQAIRNLPNLQNLSLEDCENMIRFEGLPNCTNYNFNGEELNWQNLVIVECPYFPRK